MFVGYEHPMADAGGYAYEHRLLVAAMEGRWLSPREHVHHINGDRTDNRFENLELTDNPRHLRHHNAKLDADKVKEIRRMLAKGVPQTSISAEMGVCRATISHVSTGRTWGHVR